jgi:superoxide dismutase, Cu-Zn family
MNKFVVAAATGAMLVAGIVTATNASAHAHAASAVLATADGTEIGTVVFKTNGGSTEVRVRLALPTGVDAFHGFHIHANSDPANGDGCIADPGAASSTWFVSADGHYNPTNETHSHHAGDMPVVYANPDGSVETRFAISKFAPHELDGKVVILHAGADNFANIPLGTAPTQYAANSADAIAATARTGNAGDRIACGVISTD